MLARDLFTQYVREALADLGNPVRLEMNPLADLLALDRAAGLTAAQVLRQAVREAIEALRPEADVPPDRPEWLGYHLLYQRYIQGTSQITTCEQLGLSRATYYRRHQELAEAVTGVLWQRCQGRGMAPGARGEHESRLSPDERAREEAVRLARESQQALVDVKELLQGVMETILPLARQQGIELRLNAPAALPTIYGDPITFRQILLNVLTEGIGLAAGRALELAASPDERAIVWELRGLDGTQATQEALEHVTGLVVSRGLLAVYGGRLWLEVEAPERPILCFALPLTRPRTILIIDDDTDTISLYRRYLEIHGYVLQAARNGAQAWTILAEARPDAILLDVLMPKEDGWGILQRLKTAVETAAIPVIICSVLSQPQLALALGATRVLRKPITADMLLETLREVLVQQGNWDRGYPAEP